VRVRVEYAPDETRDVEVRTGLMEISRSAARHATPSAIHRENRGARLTTRVPRGSAQGRHSDLAAGQAIKRPHRKRRGRDFKAVQAEAGCHTPSCMGTKFCGGVSNNCASIPG
jgi:hypothetical protein